MIRVFQIGLHICGTRSLWQFFKNNNFQSFHHCDHRLAEQLSKNLKDGKTHFDQDLEGPFPQKQGAFYSDMQSWKPERDGVYHNKLTGYTLFKEIDKGYPKSLFILNTRDGWVESKMKKPGFQNAYPDENSEVLQKMLIEEQESHHNNVREYFNGKNKFIEFHIQEDNISKLINWLESFGVAIQSQAFPKIRG